MKLVVQIPCFNEAETLPQALADIPTSISGVDEIVVLVVDDGSRDGTAEVAEACGADLIVRHCRNRGLASAFRTGISTALRHGADIIVNTDGDNQYCGSDIANLVQPIIQREAEIVVGDRQTAKNTEFSWSKRQLQRHGSALVRWIGGVDIPDAVSGFRAISAEAALGLTILSRFSYTTEMLIHAGYRGLAVVSVPVRTNSKTRESRLFRSIPQFLFRSGATILRAYTMYHPLRAFASIGVLFVLIGLIPILRFLTFAWAGDASGHIQSLVIGGTCLSMGVIAILFGVCAEVIASNRQLNEAILERVIRLELERLGEPVATGVTSCAGRTFDRGSQRLRSDPSHGSVG